MAVNPQLSQTPSAFQPPIRWWRWDFSEKKEHDMPEESPTVTDPICGMSVAPATAAAKSFRADPGKYTNVALS